MQVLQVEFFVSGQQPRAMKVRRYSGAFIRLLWRQSAQGSKVFGSFDEGHHRNGIVSVNGNAWPVLEHAHTLLAKIFRNLCEGR